MRFTPQDHIDVTALGHVVLFASYEQRSLVIAHELNTLRYRGPVSVLYCEDALSPLAESAVAAAQSLFGSACRLVPVSVKDPGPVMKFGRSMPESPHTLVDITCFTRGNLFSFLWSWELGYRHRPGVTVGYCPAAEYGPWLTRHFDTPHNIAGFGGPADFQKERNLLCLVGFDGDRAWSLIEYLEPYRVVLGLGTNPTRQAFVDKNREAVNAVLKHQAGEIIELPVDDPNATAAKVADIIASFGDDRTVHVAPFNNKLSCLAVYSCWLEHRDVRVWNVVPATYNYRGYSIGRSAPRFFHVSW